MPLLGAHMSVAGGMHKAVEAALAHQCQSLQVFTKSPSQWKSKPLAPEDIKNFRKAVKAAGLKKTLSHNSYLINLASPDDALFARSIDAFADEMERAEALGVDYVVAHPGAHLGSGEETGLRRIAQALDEIQRRCPGFQTLILLENTAGQGTVLGSRFEHLGFVMESVRQGERLGICFDTCHAFAAGYPLFPKEDYQATWEEFDHRAGIKKLKAFHLNDSKKGLGSRVDRHEHIGQGALGLEPFRFLIKDKRFTSLPMVLETAKEEGEQKDMDGVNLAALRKLMK
ncbi:MAG: deoxyribonuclease IV [Gemmataceae bacterium]|nr:deoxyribonuclease IV [Gemmataceae bacterium]